MSKKKQHGGDVAIAHIRRLKEEAEAAPHDDCYELQYIMDEMKVSEPTARRDITNLIALGLVEKYKCGSRVWYREL